jgi:hypothetical protein
MTTDLEQALRRALDATDRIVGPPTRDLAADAIRRHRRRRVVRRGAAGAAVLAVAVGAASLYGVARDDGTGRPAATPPVSTPPATVRLDVSSARPVEEVWPQAVRTLPGRLPDGSDYSVVEEIDAGTFVVQARVGRGRPGSVYRYRPEDGTLVRLIDAEALNPNATARVLDGRYVAVQTLELGDKPSIVEVVSVADGDQVARVDVPPGVEIDMMAWVDGRLLWTPRCCDKGVYAASDPERAIPGSEGFHLTGQGAWAVAERPSTRWWNLATDERHEVDGQPLDCLGTMCAIPSQDMRTIGTAGFDGPGGTGVLDDSRTSVSLRPVGDHFGVVHYDQVASDGPLLLWDFRTNRYAKLAERLDGQIFTGDTDILHLRWDGDEKIVVNLAAID